MGTSALIVTTSRKDNNCIVCHYDGYVEDGVGETLLKYYTDVKKVESLIDLGDIRCLGKEVEATEFTKRYSSLGILSNLYDEDVKNGIELSIDDGTVAYHRDGGEKDKMIGTVKEEDIPNLEQYWDFIYVFKNNKWYLLNKEGSLVDLSEAYNEIVYNEILRRRKHYPDLDDVY